MADNTPDVSVNSFSVNKLYDSIRIQQGVPIVDSDLNEMQDLRQMSEILNQHYTIGEGRLPAVPSSLTEGYEVIQGAATVNDFKCTAGWAVVGGVLVPTIMASPPTYLTYDADDNYICKGIVTGVSGGKISDENQNWQSFHNLVGCRVKMTSGIESGNNFTITVKDSATQVTLSSGTGRIAQDDTYILKPPVLITPSGSSRTDIVYLMVWWEDINEDEDPAILNPGVPMEVSHRLQRRWCVRVSEGGSLPSTPSFHTFTVRYLKLATLERPDSNPDILTAMITVEPNQILSWSLFFNRVHPLPVMTMITYAGAETAQLMGTWYYGPHDASPSGARFFSAHANTQGTDVFTSTGNLRYVNSLYDSTDDHVIGAADVDSDGYIVDPWIHLNNVHTGDVWILAGSKSSEILDVEDKDHGISQHLIYAGSRSCEKIFTPTLGTPGTPDFDRFYIPAGPSNLGAVLENIYASLNNLFVDDRTLDTGWDLVWRSDDIHEDSAVTSTTVSVYVSINGHLTVYGGYLTGTDPTVVAGVSGGTSILTVSGIFCGNLLQASAYATDASERDLSDAADWVDGAYRVTSGYVSNGGGGTGREEIYHRLFLGGYPFTIVDSRLIFDSDSDYTGIIFDSGSSLECPSAVEFAAPQVIVSAGTLHSGRMLYQNGDLWLTSNLSDPAQDGQMTKDDPDKLATGLKVSNEGVGVYSIQGYYASAVPLDGAETYDYDMEWQKINEVARDTGNRNLATYFTIENGEDYELSDIQSGSIIILKIANGDAAMFFCSEGVVEKVAGNPIFEDTDTPTKVCLIYYEGVGVLVRSNYPTTTRLKVAVYGILDIFSDPPS